MAQTYELLKSTTLTGSASTITLSSIPQTYTDLVLEFTTVQTGAGQVFFSASANPVQVGLVSTSPTTSSQFSYSTTQWAPFSNYNLSTTANSPTVAVINIFNYRADFSSRLQVWLSHIGHTIGNTTGRLVLSASESTSNGSISTISFDGNGQQFITGTRVRLYGILRA